MGHSLPYQTSDPAERIELEHGWEFLADPTGKIAFASVSNISGWRPARAGLSWNVQFEDLRDYMGAAWYRIKVDVPTFRDTRHVLLKFGAVDYFCEVFVNGVPVGVHEGGYTPFSFDVTSVIHPGTNELVLRVIDPPMNEAENRELFPDMMYNEIPHGKQNWYVQNSGLWQGVRMEFCPALYVDRVDVTPRIDGSFEAAIRLAGIGLTAENGSIASSTTVRSEIFDSVGRRVFEHEQRVGQANVVSVAGAISSPRLWSPDNPSLYMMDVTLSGAVEYRRRIRFGFRRIEARDGRLWLNGKPLYLMAALDQDFYPETIHTPASEEMVRDMMLKAKRLGINLLRCHLKVAHPVYLDIADEIGLLVWTEMPSWSDCWFPCDHFSMRAALRGERMFQEIMARDWNHPCIVISTIMNESWGINLKQEDQRQWLLGAFERVKEIVQPLGRLVVDNSACEGNFHLKTDIDDFHQYYSMPDQADLWDEWLAQFASRADWTFSPYGDAQRTGAEPLVVSEFGNWGLPRFESSEHLPWWFRYSFGNREVTNPDGVFERFRRFKLDTAFRDYNDLAEESQWHQFLSLKYEIESIRASGSIQGYVVTGMTDVHWEVNGLLDMWRNQKVFADDLSILQQPDLVMAKTPRATFFSGAKIEAKLLLSHYSDRMLTGARVRWSTDSGSSGQWIIDRPIAAGTVQELGSISWTAPPTAEARPERLYMEVRLPGGAKISENTLDVFVMPAPERQPRVMVHDPAHSVPALQGLTRDSEPDSLTHTMVATQLDDHVQQHLNRGGDVVLLVDHEDAFSGLGDLQVSLRKGTELDGRWFSNFNWIRADRPPFREVAFTRILGFESRYIAPAYVIQGVAEEDFDDVLCGATFGWIQKNSALALQMRCGQGRLLLTTFRFDQYGQDAYATTLLGALIRYVGSADCNPRVTTADKELTR